MVLMATNYGMANPRNILLGIRIDGGLPGEITKSRRFRRAFELDDQPRIDGNGAHPGHFNLSRPTVVQHQQIRSADFKHLMMWRMDSKPTGAEIRRFVMLIGDLIVLLIVASGFDGAIQIFQKCATDQ